MKPHSKLHIHKPAVNMERQVERHANKTIEFSGERRVSEAYTETMGKCYLAVGISQSTGRKRRINKLQRLS